MNITEYTIHNKTVTWMIVLLLIFGGIFSFNNLGRLEDPAFTIKQAMILIDYPGASALEVEEELTLPVETHFSNSPIWIIFRRLPVTACRRSWLR